MRALALSTEAFLTNRRGYPTLSKAHQELLTSFWRQGVQVWHSVVQCTLHLVALDCMPAIPGQLSCTRCRFIALLEYLEPCSPVENWH